MCEFTTTEHFQELERQRATLAQQWRVVNQKHELRKNTEAEFATVRRCLGWLVPWCHARPECAGPPNNNPTTQQPNNPTTQQPNNPTTQQPNNPTTLQPYNPTTQQPNNPTTHQVHQKSLERLRSKLVEKLEQAKARNTTLVKLVHDAAGGMETGPLPGGTAATEAERRLEDAKSRYCARVSRKMPQWQERTLLEKRAKLHELKRQEAAAQRRANANQQKADEDAQLASLLEQKRQDLASLDLFERQQQQARAAMRAALAQHAHEFSVAMGDEEAKMSAVADDHAVQHLVHLSQLSAGARYACVAACAATALATLSKPF